MKSIELLYSADGKAYGSIAEIKPRGTNSFYEYTNDSTAAGNNFYQLKMNDLDGRVSYSSVIIVKCENLNGQVQGRSQSFQPILQISVASVSGGPSALILYDVQGRMRAEKKIQMLTGNNSVLFDGWTIYLQECIIFRLQMLTKWNDLN